MATRLMFRSFKHKKRKVTINLCENCSHFTLKYFQLNSFGKMCFLEENYKYIDARKKKQKQNKNKNKIKQKKNQKKQQHQQQQNKTKKKKKKKKKKEEEEEEKKTLNCKTFESALYMKSLSMSL